MLIENDITRNINEFDTNKVNYSIEEFTSHTVYKKDINRINLKVRPTSKNNDIYIGENLSGKITIRITGSGNTVYIGNNCKLNDFIINIKGKGIKVIIGNEVTCTADCIINAGQNSDPKFSNLIIGDDVMMAKHCSIYTSDNHPIYEIETFSRINTPEKNVIIEPHVWLGQGTIINKSNTIGAGSVIATGAIITKDVPRFSLVGGVPAKIIKRNIIWSRHEGEVATDKAKNILERFKSEP